MVTAATLGGEQLSPMFPVPDDAKPLIRHRMLVIISADKGRCGSFNQHVTQVRMESRKCPILMRVVISSAMVSCPVFCVPFRLIPFSGSVMRLFVARFFFGQAATTLFKDLLENSREYQENTIPSTAILMKPRLFPYRSQDLLDHEKLRDPGLLSLFFVGERAATTLLRDPAIHERTIDAVSNVGVGGNLNFASVSAIAGMLSLLLIIDT